MNIHLRQEEARDYTLVYNLVERAFNQVDESKLIDVLRESDAFIPELSLVAMASDQLVGHILFTKINIINDAGEAFESLALAPMAVIPDLHKQGVGGQLIRYGLDRARELGYTSVIVLGHEHYYPKFGFEPAENWGIKAPFDVPSNVFMGIELIKNGLTGVSGTVKYAKAFESV